MDKNKIHKVSTIYETDSRKQANEYLRDGWILLEVCASPINILNENSPKRLVYSLGKIDPDR